MPQPIRILLFTGEPQIINAIAEALKTSQIACLLETVANQAAFSNQFNTFTPDIILTHDAAPYHDGLAQLRAIKAAAPGVPVIFVTRSPQNDAHAIEVIQAGAEDYLPQDRLFLLPIAILKALEKKKLLEEKTRAEEALRASEYRYRQMVHFAPAPMALYDDGKLALMNAAAADLFGVPSPEALIGSPLLAAVHPDSHEIANAAAFDAPIGELTPFQPYHLQRLDGSTVAVESACISFMESGRRLTQVIAYPMAEQREVIARQKELAAIVEASDDAIFRKDRRGVIRSWNKGAERIYGYSAEEMIGQSLRVLIPPERDHEFDLILNAVGRGDTLEHFDTVRVRKDGTRVNMLLTISPIRDDQGMIIGDATVARDITAQKQAEQELQRHHAILQGILESSHALIFSIDAQYRYTSFNRRHAAAMQALYGAEIHLGDSLLDAMTVAEDRDIARRNLDRALQGELVEEEATSGDTQHSRRYFGVSHYPIRDPHGAVTGVAVFARDITERKQAEVQIVAQNAFLHTVIDSLSHPFCVIDANNYTITLANRAISKAAVGSPCYVMMHQRMTPCDGAEHQCPLAEVKRTKQPAIVEHIHRDDDGLPLYFEIHAYPILDATGEVVQVIEYGLDITARKQAELALIANEERYRLAIRAAQAVPYSRDYATETYTFLSPEIGALTGYAAEEFTPEIMESLIDEAIPEGEFEGLSLSESVKLSRGGDRGMLWICAYRLHTRSGEMRWVKDSSVQVLDEQGRPKGSVGILQDITQRKQAETSLLMFNQAIDAASNGIAITDPNQPDNPMIYVNSAFEQLTGYPREAAIGRNCRFLHGDDHAQPGLDVIREALKDERGCKVSLRNYRRDGQPFDVELTISPVRDAAGRLIYFIGVQQDITEQRKAAAALQASEQRFRSTFENAHIGIVTVDLKGSIIQANQRMAEMFGYMLAEFQQKHINDFTHPDYLDISPRFIQEAISGKTQRGEFEKAYLHRDGHIVWGRVSSTLVKDQGGTPLYFISHVLDMTREKEAEKALQEKLELEQRLAQITQTAPGGLCSFLQRADGTVCMPYVSPSWEELYDVRAADVRDDASIIFQRMHPDDVPHVIQTIQTSADTMTDWRDEFRILNPVKGELWVEGHSTPTRQPDGSLLWNGFITDITARKRAELALQQLNQELEQRIAERTAELADLYDYAPCGYHSLDRNGVFLRINNTELRWLGYSAGELIGKKSVLDLMTPEAQQTFFKNFPIFMQRGFLQDLELVLIRKDGSLLPILLNATAVYDSAGNFLMSRSTLIDYTERKLAESERERARDAANAANRAKSEFLANMSHELRTPLNSILGYAQILQKADNLHERQREGVRTIRESGEHLLTLITDILDMSKIEAGRMDVQMYEFHLAEFLKRIAQMIRVRTEQKRLSFALTVAPNVPDYIAADERKLRQVLVNLLGNAIKFTEQGRISLSVAVFDPTPNPSPKGRGACSPLSFGEGAGVRSENFAALPSQNQNIWLRFEVADSGIGIAPDDLPKLFVPFRQVGARYASEGTGLGLAISAKFVSLMGGELHVESEPGRGSRFWFDLPVQLLAQAETPAAAPPYLSGEVVGYAGTRRLILTIDDKTANRAILVNMLEPLGFQMLEADNGFSGLELALSRHPDLILLDLRMPDMDGFEVARRLRAHPAGQTCKIIAVSASVQSDVRQNSLAAGCNEFLSKPVIFEELQRVLTAQLGVTWLTTEQAQENIEPAQPEPAASALALPPDLAAQLREKAERGDIRAVTRLLDQLAERDPRYAPIVEQLRQLAKNFQVDEIAKILRELES